MFFFFTLTIPRGARAPKNRALEEKFPHKICYGMVSFIGSTAFVLICGKQKGSMNIFMTKGNQL